jgi:carbon-monoxide dehydrogenase medium subunit
MTPFELHEPPSLREAIELLDSEDPTVRPIAGGTALMLMMKAGVFRPSKLVSLHKITSLAAIASEGKTLKIGAMTSLSALERSQAVRAHAPVVTRTLRSLSNVRVRNVATVGGNLAHADPHMDLPPVLIALDASITIEGRSSRRSIPVEELFSGYYETALARDELITELTVPGQGARRAAYLKCTTRAVHDWPALGIAVSIDGEGADIDAPRVVISAATEKPTRLAAVEQIIAGKAAGDDLYRQAGDAAADTVDFTTDAQGTAAYKRQLARVYVGRALRAALAGGPGAH